MKIQCKDVDKVDVLRSIEFVQRVRHAFFASRWDIQDVLEVRLGRPLPEKLVLAKLRQMIRAGWITGCTCGCRGDFEIADMIGPVRYIEIPITPPAQRSYDYTFPKVWIVGGP